MEDDQEPNPNFDLFTKLIKENSKLECETPEFTQNFLMPVQ